jgi:dipeptidyl-peptidase-4
MDKSKSLTQKDYKARLLSKSKITSADVANLPKPGTTAPALIKFLGEDKLAYLLPPDATSMSRELFVLNTKSGDKTQIKVGGVATEEGKFSLEEQMRRERARLMATGVTSYELSKENKDGKVIGLIPNGGGLYIWDTTTNDPRLLVDSTHDNLPEGATILDAKISADGSTVAFVANEEVYVMPVEGNGEGVSPTQITSGARDVDGRTNGVSDYLAMEELSRPEGFWLSPNGKLLAFEQVDEGHIPPYRLVHQAAPGGLAPSLVAGMSAEDMVEATKVSHEEHRFCFAGTVNPKVKLGIQSTTLPGSMLWLDIDSIFGPDVYLAKVEWLKDGDGLVVQVLDRRQKKLALVMFDAVTGSRTNLHLEESIDEKAWVNLNDSFRVLDYTPGEKLQFLWASEGDGYRHLFVRETNLSEGKHNDFHSKELFQVTGPGEFIVDDVVDIDAEKKLVYYMGTSPGKWLGKHLFRAKLESDGGEPECMTAQKGIHGCIVNSKAGIFVDSVSTVDHPTTVSLQSLDKTNKARLDIYDAGLADPRVAQLNLKAPTFHTFPSTDQKVTLQSAIYLPDESVYGSGPYPLVVATYGGPHVQYVCNTWGMMTADLRTQYLCENGFAVIKVDNRGSNRRGLNFETQIFGNMGELEVADQAAGVQYAIDQGWANPNKVAVIGWSYGGYMALKCLSDRPDVFNAAVSGAPVTDWTLYDSAYTERYMDLPSLNVEGYQKASALSKVEDIEGSLMLCHGLLDENVLFRQSAVLINKLIEHQKAYELQLFPSERHGPRRPQDRAFLEERILSFLQRSLNL